jgi:hypothetical protein
MKYISLNYQYLEDLGFEDRCAYWEKEIGYSKYIRIYCDNCEIRFFTDDGYGNDVEIDACVPIWAFPTMVKMVQMGFIKD